MNRFTKMLLIVAVALGCFAMFSADSAEAGWSHGQGCYRSGYSTSYSYVSNGYRPTYRCDSSYVVPAIYRPASYNTCYSSPSWYGGNYGGGYGCGYSGGYSGGYGGHCGGFGGYQPLTNYGCYSGIANGYVVPVSYGHCGW